MRHLERQGLIRSSHAAAGAQRRVADVQVWRRGRRPVRPLPPQQRRHGAQLAQAAEGLMSQTARAPKVSATFNYAHFVLGLITTADVVLCT